MPTCRLVRMPARTAMPVCFWAAMSASGRPTAPTSTLHLYSTILNNPFIYLETNTSNPETLLAMASRLNAPGLVTQFSLLKSRVMANSVSFALANSPWTRLVNIQQSGNVGIGTTGPTSPLVVTAPTTFTSGTLTSVVAPAAAMSGVTTMTGLNVNMSAPTISGGNRRHYSSIHDSLHGRQQR